MSVTVLFAAGGYIRNEGLYRVTLMVECFIAVGKPLMRFHTQIEPNRTFMIEEPCHVQINDLNLQLKIVENMTDAYWKDSRADPVDTRGGYGFGGRTK